MHSLIGALPLSYVLARVTRGALVSHGRSVAPPRCRTSQYCRTFVPLSVSLWNNLSDPVFDGRRLAGFKSRATAFLLAQSALSFCLLLFSFSLTCMGWLCGFDVFILIECPHSLSSWQ